MQKLVSIIVPVYNVEKYIDKCVRSLLKQDYGNIEVILVDDGSPDKSGYIIDGVPVFQRSGSRPIQLLPCAKGTGQG